jgi:hypothetical protein
MHIKSMLHSASLSSIKRNFHPGVI